MTKGTINKQTEKTRHKTGEIVPASGEYELVNAQGKKTDYDIVTLDEGEKFPSIKDSSLYFRMSATCLEGEEACELPDETEELPAKVNENKVVMSTEKDTKPTNKVTSKTNQIQTQKQPEAKKSPPVQDHDYYAEIGRKGGEAVSRDRQHMSEIGRLGGLHSHDHDHVKAHESESANEDEDMTPERYLSGGLHLTSELMQFSIDMSLTSLSIGYAMKSMALKSLSHCIWPYKHAFE